MPADSGVCGVTASGLHFTTAKHTLATSASDPLVGIVKLPISMASFLHVLKHTRNALKWVENVNYRRKYRNNFSELQICL